MCFFFFFEQIPYFCLSCLSLSPTSSLPRSPLFLPSWSAVCKFDDKALYFLCASFSSSSQQNSSANTNPPDLSAALTMFSSTTLFDLFFKVNNKKIKIKKIVN